MRRVGAARVYRDREEAGEELGRFLAPLYRGTNALVLGIPRGGVIVGYGVARAIHGELSALVTKKLPHPDQEELAIGACAEDGSMFLTSLARNLDSSMIQTIVRRQQEEIASRVDRFRNGEPLPDMNGRTVIVVDDGIATGSTLVPALKLCRTRSPLRLVVAAPVSGHRYVAEIDSLADEVHILQKPEDFLAVGQVYADFHHLNDGEVTTILDQPL